MAKYNRTCMLTSIIVVAFLQPDEDLWDHQFPSHQDWHRQSTASSLDTNHVTSNHIKKLERHIWIVSKVGIKQTAKNWIFQAKPVTVKYSLRANKIESVTCLHDISDCTFDHNLLWSHSPVPTPHLCLHWQTPKYKGFILHFTRWHAWRPSCN